MITALCMNPCIDKTVEIDGFKYGKINRILTSRQDGSGKGVNVTLASGIIGNKSVCIGAMAYGKSKSIIKRFSGNAVADFTMCEGEVRTNLKVMDISLKVMTEINDKGVVLTREIINTIEDKCIEYAKKSSWLVLTGSLPPGCSQDWYAKVIARVHSEAPDCKCLLDTEGSKLELGLLEKPFMIKPNDYELGLLFGDISDLYKIKSAAQQLVAGGVSIVLVSLGGDGAIITDGEITYYAPVLELEVKSAAGAGDSMVAGFINAFDLGLSLRDCFTHSVAAASASVITEGTKLIDKDAYIRFLDKVIIEEV